MNRLRVLMALAGAVLAVGLVAGLRAPADALQGIYARILPVHASTAWVGFLAFGVTAAGSIGWRLRRTRRWDRLAAGSAELGVLFTAVAIVTGSLWGGAVWGTYWDWGDARMATTALMLFVYLGYLALRGASPDQETAAARSSILGIVAVVQVPLVYFSVNMFRTLHQTQSIRPDGATMPRQMLLALLVNVVAFTFVYLVLLAARTRVMALEEEQAAPSAAAAGAAVQAPRLGEATDG